ncbi:NACHT, LRR and PYD domains-containing protein 12-like [Lissotriton helveticus]
MVANSKPCSGTREAGAASRRGEGKKENSSNVPESDHESDSEILSVVTDIGDYVSYVEEPIECIDPVAEIIIGGKPLNLLVDSGARITMLTKELFLETWGERMLLPPDRSPVSSKGRKIDLMGYFEDDLLFKGRKMRGKVYIAVKGLNILGWYHQGLFDDVLIHTKDIASHNLLLKKVFEIFKDHGVVVKPEKCKFLSDKIEYFGHLISGGRNVRADFLSRFPSDMNKMNSILDDDCENDSGDCFIAAIALSEHSLGSEECWLDALSQDEFLQQVCDYVRSGWPNHKTKYKQYIKEEFRKMKDNDSRIGETVSLEGRYTKLLILKHYRNKKDKEHEIMSCGKRHLELMEERAADSYSSIKDLFSPEKDGHIPRTLVLQGVAGIGKTMTARKIMFDWASGKLFKHRFEYVFYIHCREYNQLSAQRPIADLILPSIEGGPCLSISDIEANPERMLFIIDGFDELKIPEDLLSGDPDKKSPEGKTIFSLLRNRYIQDSYKIITTRPTALDALEKCVKDERFAEILGFSEAGRKEYFTRFFGDEIQAALAIRIVKENEILYTMCFVPIVCWIVCSVIKEQMEDKEESLRDLRTITSVYLLFLFNLLKQQSIVPVQQNITSNLKSLCALAEDGIYQQKILFEENDIVKHGVDIPAVQSLFLNNIVFKECTDMVSVYSFIHLTFQEFFAALFYILDGNDTTAENTESPQRAVTRLLKEYTELGNNHLMLTVRFLFGLLSKERLDKISSKFQWEVSPEIKPVLQAWITEKLKQEVDRITSHMVDLFQYLYETQDEEFVTTEPVCVKHISITKSTMRREMSPMDFRALAFCLQHSRVESINLQDIPLRPEDIQALKPLIMKCPSLRMRNCSLRGSCCEALASVLETNTSLTELELGRNGLRDTGMKKLCEGLKHPNCKLQTLRLDECSLTGSCCKDLASVLETHTFLTELDLKHNELRDAGVKKLCEGLKHPNCKLQTLRLELCSLTGSCCKDLASVLETNTFLTELDLKCNELRDAGVKKLCEGLKHPNCKLQTLRLECCFFSSSCCKDLASVLKTNSSLTELELSYNHLRDSGVKTLCEGLNHPNCKLQTLRLEHCSLTGSCCGDLASVLETNSSLTELELSRNEELQDTGVKKLCEGLKHTNCKLQTLRLDRCSLTGSCCKDLASVLETNTSLTELELSCNRELGDTGVKKLCEGLKHPICKLQTLRLGGCSLTGSCCKDLASVLETNTSLTELELSCNRELGDTGVKKLCEGLKHPNCKLQTLRLDRCSLNGSCCEDLASALETNSSLTELDLSCNEELRDTGVKKLCEGLKHPNCKLQTLSLLSCSLTDSCCEDLASVLETNTSLKELDLSCNHLRDSGVKTLCEGLNHPNCKLQTLSLDGEKLSHETPADLREALLKMLSRRELKLNPH